MKKIALFLAGAMFLCITLVACFDAKDFDFDKITPKGLSPTLYLPLVDTVMTLSSEEYQILYDEDGQGYFSIDVKDNINLPEMSDFLALPQNETVSVGQTNFTYPGGGASIDPKSREEEFPLEDGNDQRIDSMYFGSGQLTLTPNPQKAPNVGYYTIAIPSLIKNGVPFYAEVPCSGAYFPPEDLTGYVLKLSNGNKFVINLGMELPASVPAGEYSFGLDIDLSNMDVQRAYGYFGKKQISTSPQHVAITAFDNFKNNSLSTSLQIKEAFFLFGVNNAAGFPIQLKIAEISAGTRTATNLDSLLIASNTPSDAYVSTTGRLGGEKLGELLSDMPDAIDFTFLNTINPGEGNGDNVHNFFTETSGATVTEAKVIIPLTLKVNNMVIEQNMDFDFSQIVADNLELLLNVENNMPMSVELQAVLVDDNKKEIIVNGAPAVLFDPVIIPPAQADATGVTNQLVPVLNPDVVTRAKGLSIKVIMNTPSDGGFVRITKANKVRVKIGGKAQVNVDNISF